MFENVTRWTSADGKYEVVLENPGSKFYALRYGQPWRSLAGDNLVLAMFQALTKETEDAPV